MNSIRLYFTANPSVKWSGELHNHQKYWKLIVVKITVFLSHGLRYFAYSDKVLEFDVTFDSNWFKKWHDIYE